MSYVVFIWGREMLARYKHLLSTYYPSWENGPTDFRHPSKGLVGFDSYLWEAPVCVLPIAWQHSTWAWNFAFSTYVFDRPEFHTCFHVCSDCRADISLRPSTLLRLLVRGWYFKVDSTGPSDPASLSLSYPKHCTSFSITINRRSSSTRSAGITRHDYLKMIYSFMAAGWRLQEGQEATDQTLIDNVVSYCLIHGNANLPDPRSIDLVQILDTNRWGSWNSAIKEARLL